MRVPAEDIRQVQTDINGHRYTAHNGFFEMPDHHAKAHLKSAEYGASWSPVQGGYKQRSGYRCTECGFGSFFRVCSRCHSECVKETS